MPADIYNSGVVVEVEGVDLQLKVLESEESSAPSGKSNSGYRYKSGVAKTVKANRARSPHPAVHDPGGQSSEEDVESEDEDASNQLPTTDDLAQSFLQAEPQEEKVELQAAIESQSQYLPDSAVSSYDGEAALGFGTAAGLSLPGFLAGFLRGVCDKLKIRVKRVELSLALQIATEVLTGTPCVNKGENVIFKLCINDVDVESLFESTDQKDQASEQQQASKISNNPLAGLTVTGKRCIILHNIRGILITEAALFSTLSRPPAATSSTPTKLDDAVPIHAERPSGPPSSSPTSSEGLGMTQSTIFHTYEESGRGASRLEASVATSDGGRFADAGIADDVDAPETDHEGVMSVSGSSFLDDSRIRNELLNSRFDDNTLEDSVTPPAFALKSPPVLGEGTLPIRYDHEQGEVSIPSHPTRTNIESKTSGGSRMTGATPSLDIVDGRCALALSRPFLSVGASLLQTDRTDNLVSGAQAIHELSRTERESDVSVLPPTEDLSESKLFSHEEAASMYMSAISHASSKAIDESNVPGGWKASSSTSANAASNSSMSETTDAFEESRSLFTAGSLSTAESIELHPTDREEYDQESGTPSPQSQLRNSDQLQDDIRSGIGVSPPQPHLEQETRRLSTSDSSHSPETSYSPTLIAKCVFSIDQCSIKVPIPKVPTAQPASDLGSDTVLKRPSSDLWEMPGAFSRTLEESHKLPRPRKIGSRGIGKSEFTKSSSGRDNRSTLKVDQLVDVAQDIAFEFGISTVQSHFDFAVGRLLAAVVQQLVASIDRHSASSKPDDVDGHKVSPTYGFTIENASIKLLEHLRGFNLSSLSDPKIGALDKAEAFDDNVLLVSTVKDLHMSRLSAQDSSTVQMSIAKFLFGYANNNILSFDAGLKMRDSVRDDQTPDGKDLSISIIHTGDSSKISLTTLPVHISIDLQRLDETFSWFGGFSTILELGSSMTSTNTVVGAGAKQTQTSKRSRAVHFATTSEQDVPEFRWHQSSNKANARIGGFVLNLTGRLCSIRLESTAMKVVSREEGVGLQVDKIKLNGPYLMGEDHEPSITAALTNIRVEYLSTPKEVDLGRLLSLLTPSADKYDHDDDILVETLLRQRRQGGVLRVTIADVKTEVLDLDSLKLLPTLVDDASKLSTVAKYLPEDDRPGILTLGLIRDLNFHVKLNQAIGDMQFRIKNLELAHVGLPSLLALCIEGLQLQRNHDEELIGQAVTANSANPHGQTPMVMARLIGDELEPTFKLKLWNVRLEYRVSTIMAVLGLSDTMTAEDVASDLVNSVITLTGQPVEESGKPASESPSSSAQSTAGSKPLKLDIVFRDFVVGLNPRNLPHKGLVVITDARFFGSILKRDNPRATMEIGKATFLIIDDVKNILAAEVLPETDPVDSKISQVQELCNMGYVAVSYISSARAQIKIIESERSGEKSIDVELRDDLFVLESCADSTQTIFNLLNGLKPPMPPSKEIKYRTEIVPVQDMLASLSGDAFGQIGGPQHEGYEYPLELDDGDMVDDDVPQNFEFVNSFYRRDPEPTSEELADSFLEEDLGHLVTPPVTREIGDKNLLQSFQEQYEIAPGGEPLDFREDHFGTRPAFQGKAHRWNPAQNTYSLEDDNRVRRSPLRVRVRDAHFIWNLFDGYDWQKTRDVISKTVRDVELRATERKARNDRRLSFDVEDEEESVIGDFLFNSIYIGIPANRDPRELSHHVNRNVEDHASETDSYATSTISGSPSRQGHSPRLKRRKLRLSRSKHHKMTFELKGVSADLVVFPPNSGETQSSIDVRVKDLEIFDHVPTSTWKKFATYMHDAGERESGSNMIHLEIMNVKPVPELAASEIVLKVRLSKMLI